MTAVLAAQDTSFVGVLLTLGKILLIAHVILILGALMVWAERRVSALMQDRRGPNRLPLWGILQSIADLGKFIFKEDVVPGHVHRWMYVIAPAVALMPAMITFAVIPYARDMQIADLNIGILYVLSIASLGVYGITLGGWASNSKYSLFGGVRSSAQMISYEVFLGLSAVGVVMTAGDLHLGRIVDWQADHGWFLFHQPLAFLIFLTASYAETNRLPFDMPEAETELVAGYHTEYSSMKFALFFLAEYTNMIVGSALVTTLFLGGWSFFGLEDVGASWSFLGLFSLAWVPGVVFFSAKTLVLLFTFIWVRWTIPRFRYDQVMAIGWKWMFPLALGNAMVTAVGITYRVPWVVLAASLAALGLVAVGVAQRRDPGPPPPLAPEPAAGAARPARAVRSEVAP
jgi:NADH-quinone oxidoreductase subunit H